MATGDVRAVRRGTSARRSCDRCEVQIQVDLALTNLFDIFDIFGGC